MRKVRAPHSGVAGNTRPSKDEDKSHRDESSLGGRVKRGNLYAEQDQIGKESEKSETCGRTGNEIASLVILPGRLQEAASNAGPRWIITGQDKTCLQNPAYRSASKRGTVYCPPFFFGAPSMGAC